MTTLKESVQLKCSNNLILFENVPVKGMIWYSLL